MRPPAGHSQASHEPAGFVATSPEALAVADSQRTPGIPGEATPPGHCRPLQGPRRSLPDRHRPRHVADRLRRALPPHHVPRQADARPRPDAGHRPRQPRLPRQARRPRRRLSRPRQQPQGGAPRLRTPGRDGRKPIENEQRDRGSSPPCSRSWSSAATPSMASTTASSSPDADRAANRHRRRPGVPHPA